MNSAIGTAVDNIEIGGQNLLTKVNQGRDPAAERTLNRGGQLFKTYGVVDNYDAEQVMGISFEAKITTTGTSRSFQVYAYQTSGETITGAVNSAAAITYITPTTE